VVSTYGLKIGQTWLGFDEVIVRIVREEPPPKDSEAVNFSSSVR
jgi:hypothetical protein